MIELDPYTGYPRTANNRKAEMLAHQIVADETIEEADPRRVLAEALIQTIETLRSLQNRRTASLHCDF